MSGFSAIHFQGFQIWQVCCYTLLREYRLPWSSSCCLDLKTPFVGSDEPELEHFIFAFGASRIASPAYQEWPTKSLPYYSIWSLKHQIERTYLKFENWLRKFIPQDHLSCLYPMLLYFLDFCYTEVNFRGNQLLDCSISLSPLYSNLGSDLHVSIPSNFHQNFFWLHPIQT